MDLTYEMDEEEFEGITPRKALTLLYGGVVDSITSRLKTPKLPLGTRIVVERRQWTQGAGTVYYVWRATATLPDGAIYGDAESDEWRDRVTALDKQSWALSHRIACANLSETDRDRLKSLLKSQVRRIATEPSTVDFQSVERELQKALSTA